MMNREEKKRKLYFGWLAVAVLVIVFVAPVLAQDEPNEPFLPDQNMPEELLLPGTVEGTGTYFEVTDSNYLNITFKSSEPVHLRLESVPQMIVMDINTASGAASTQITLTGFEPSTTYYKYEDDYHNGIAFTTDDNGTYTFAQDLAQPHMVFIQPNPGTIFIPSDTSVGNWDPITRTYTLTTDVYETIQIDEDNLTLDGAGRTVSGSGGFYGIYLYGRTGVTIRNVNVEQFSYAINLYSSSNNTLTGNRVSNNYCGIWLRFSSSNTLTDNTASNNQGYGIYLSDSRNNSLTDNRANSTSNGTYGYGIYLYNSSNNTLTGNIVESNKDFGIFLASSGGSTLSTNTMSGNSYNFYVYGWSTFDFDNDINKSNTVDGKPIYYVKNATGVVYDSSTNAGVFYAINCDNITIKDLTLTKNWFGVFLWKTHNSRIENVTASNNSGGICLYYSNSNTLTTNATSNNGSGIHLLYSNNNSLTGNTASDNQYGIYPAYSSDNALTNNTANQNYGYGIYLCYYCDRNILIGNTVASNKLYGIRIYVSSSNTLIDNTAKDNTYGIYLSYSNGNTLTENTASNNYYGIRLSSSSDNQIYNNNFINNTTQAVVYGGSSNVFNLERPIGGNYWSDCICPDNDGDGFVDYPYVFTGGQDNFPWVYRDGCLPNQPPVADAGNNIQIASVDQVYTVIQGTASDPDENLLEYRWLEGEQVLLDWTSVGENGEAHLDLGILTYLAIGNHTLTLEVSDCQVTALDEMILMVQNSPPAAQPAPSSQVVEIGIDEIVVVADVADFDGDTLSYDWLKDGEVLSSGEVETQQGGVAVPIPDLSLPAGDPIFEVGLHQIELRISDAVNPPVSAFVSVEVTDTTAPSLSPIPSVTILWPPDHELQPVTIAANAFDNGGGAIILTVEVQSSEPPDTDGDGHTIPDYYIDSVDNDTGLIELRLRSERQGNGDGRTYTITISATDESGNQSLATVEILAPHDRRKK